MDDDYRTHWTASKWYGNEHVEVTFTEPVGLSAALWVPRLDGQYPNWLRCYSIRVWTDAAHGGLNGKLIVPDEDHGGRDDGATGNSSAMQTWPNVRNNPSQTHVAILPFGPLEGITKIQVAVEQIGYNLVSLSELKFVEYDPENDIPYLTQTAIGVRKELSVFGNDYNTRDGYCIRDFIDVVDLARAHVIAVERMLEDKSPEKIEIFNLGTGNGLSVMELINAFESATGVKVPYKIAPRRAGDIEQVWANPAYANEVLGWKAETPIEDTMRSAWAWQLRLRERGVM